jgi:hypothetical protein
MLGDKSMAFMKMKFRKEPRRGDKIIAQGKRSAALGTKAKYIRAPAGAKENMNSVAPPGLRAQFFFLSAIASSIQHLLQRRLSWT